MDGLAAYVEQQLQADPFSGVVYVFRSKRADKVKQLFWDQTGLVLVTKRLEDGRFRWPAVQDGVMRLSPAQLSALLEGWSAYARDGGRLVLDIDAADLLALLVAAVLWLVARFFAEASRLEEDQRSIV